MRTEKDFLGPRSVPDEVYYGVQTLRAVENFPITGERLHPLLVRALVMVKDAAARANLDAGVLTPEIGGAIVRACEEILGGGFDDEFVVDPIQGGAGTSANMNVNEVVANRAVELLGGHKGEYSIVSPNSHVNAGQSTNDVFPTALRISALWLTERLQQTLASLREEMLRKSAEFDDVIKLGRTHLQDAVPITLGQEFAAYAAAIERDQRRISEAQDALHDVNMGATAVGTALNAEPVYVRAVVEHLRNISGLDLRPARNLVDGTQNTDAMVELSGALKVLATNLTKIMNDLRLMASGPRAGLFEINLPARQPGSSIMPGKVNPVLPEVVNQACFLVIGHDLTIALASAGGQLELNVFEPVMAYCLLQSLTVLDGALGSFIEQCLKGITPNRERCRQLAEGSINIVTALSPTLGYERTAEIAREAFLNNRSVREVALEKGVTPADLERLLSVEHLRGLRF